MMTDVAMRSQLRQRIAIPRPEIDARDRVQIVRRQRTVVDPLSVRGQLDTVETFLLIADGHAKLVVVARTGEIGGQILVHAKDGWVFGKTTPGFAGTEIEHYEAGAAFVAGVDLEIC